MIASFVAQSKNRPMIVVIICSSIKEPSPDCIVEALYSDDNGDYCYLIKDGKVEKDYITTGIRDDSTVEVTEGIAAGDRVITDSVTDDDIGKKANYVTH